MEILTSKQKQYLEQPKERISGSEAIVRCLLAEGVEILYGYPGSQSQVPFAMRDKRLDNSFLIVMICCFVTLEANENKSFSSLGGSSSFGPPISK